MERRFFPEDLDPQGRSYDDLRWGRFKNRNSAEMFSIVAERVFPFLRTLAATANTAS